MPSKANHLIPTFLFCLAAAGMGDTVRANKQGVNSALKEVKVAVAPHKFHEECLALEARQSIRFSFSAARSLDFNIHYHKDKDILYPVRAKEVTAHKGEFTAKEAGEYCLMWENAHHDSIVLTYEFQRF